MSPPRQYPKSLHVRISVFPRNSPTCRGGILSHNEVGLSTQGGRYQKSQMYLQALACSLHGGQRPPLPHLTFGTAQVRRGAGRNRVRQPSHYKEARSSLLSQVVQAGYTGLIGSAYQRPWETDVPCLSGLSYPQCSFFQELTEA